MRRTAKEGGRIIGSLLLEEGIDLADEQAIRKRICDVCGSNWTTAIQNATLEYLRKERSAEEVAAR